MFRAQGLRSIPDPFLVNEYSAPPNGVGFYNLNGLTQVSSIPPAPATTKIVIIDGQSEMATANGTAPYATISASANQLNIYDGAIYQGSEPVQGASNAPATGQSSIAMRFADSVISRGKATQCIVVPIAIGGTPWAIYDPAAAGSLFLRFKAAYLRLQARGLAPNAIITARGATDNTLATSAASVKASIWAWADGVRALGCVAPIYLGKYTMAGGAVSATVQSGIDQAIDVGRNIVAGYNADANLTVAGGFRLADGTHLSNTGLAAAATAWSTIVFP